LEQLRVKWYCVTSYENEKDEFRVMLEEDKVKIQREKDELLIEKIVVKEVVSRELHSVSGLAQEEHEAVKVQVMKLAEAIQQLQERVMKLEIRAVPSTLQEVCDQREEAAKSAVERKSLLGLTTFWTSM
jgi:hypothetical protein